MFFPEKITRIESDFSVLEIGPGADPHPRSDIFLELKLQDESEYITQFGHDRKLVSDKPVVYYDGVKFPFGDHEFDYVICSHVLEHVPNTEAFLSEVFRVAKQGYFEFPLITYEYLHNLDAHLNYLRWTGSELLILKKNESPLDYFKPVQNVFFETLTKGYNEYYTRLPEHFFQGFQWDRPFSLRTTSNVSELVGTMPEIPLMKTDLSTTYSGRDMIKALMKKVTRTLPFRK